ncbi:MAG: hypothetical protein LBQ68_10220 [Clostridiales bacterium]|jgi:aspartyl/glutamyl-tRNA(Asn/Gln) amidotransferase C subunit|nr:hypothetical protein [Clostridiales bacterium]
MAKQGVTRLAELSKIHFTLEELEEMNRDMESIMKLMDYIKEVELPPEPEEKFGSNIVYLRPDKIREWKLNKADKTSENTYFKIPRIID